MSEGEEKRKAAPNTEVWFEELSSEENKEFAELAKELKEIYKDKQNKEERAPRRKAIVKRVGELQEKAWSASTLAERLRKNVEEWESK